MTRFCLNVERVQKRDCPQLPLAEQLMAALKDRLPDDASCFAVEQDGPSIVICHQGRALGLHLKQERLTAVQVCCFRRLRSAGMRIETARTYPEAMRMIADMGVTLRPEINSIYAQRDFFREETRRR